MVLNKSVYLNVADSPYLNADWKARSTLVNHLYTVNVEVKRLLDLGTLTNTLSDTEISRLGGIGLALGFVEEAFGNVNTPIRKVREHIKIQRDDLESQLLMYRKSKKTQVETDYLVTAIHVLENILAVTESLESDEYQLMNRV